MPDVLLQLSKQLTKAADKWPLSEARRLDVLRLAKRIRTDYLTTMSDTDIELLLISAAADGCRTVDDFSDETGLSKKETGEILHRMWQMGTFEKVEEMLHDRGRPSVVFVLAGHLSFKANKSLSDDLDFIS